MNDTGWKIYTPPPVVGWWLMPGSVPGCRTQFAVYKKPSWLHIKLMALLLGWKYEEVK